MCFEIEKCVTKAHPSLAGHFPGNPIVPGVVLLDEIIETLLQCHSGLKVEGISSVKFLAPLLPGEKFVIQLQTPEKGKLKFSCFVEDRKLAIGQFKVE